MQPPLNIQLSFLLLVFLFVTSACSPDLSPNREQAFAPARVTTSSQTTPGRRLPSLDQVSHWLYFIDSDLEPEIVNQIIASSHDLVVIDYIISEHNHTAYPLADLVDRLHQAGHPKLVLAYIDIGQAEDYRTYWQPNWRVGNPPWIIAADPDGWSGNYPVAYWRDAYQALWLYEPGYLQGILDAGFDGVYLDWVEAYEDEDVLAFARQAGVDPRQEMVAWVGEIAAFVRSQRPGFIFIAQNASELVHYDDYVAIIDAIAQEHVWFDGGADNHPSGDCPLPATDADIGTPAYLAALSLECLWQYAAYPQSALHTSSESYISDMKTAQQAGLVIFTVDYATQPDNVAYVYKTSRDLGFIPFVTTRSLDAYTPPSP